MYSKVRNVLTDKKCIHRYEMYSKVRNVQVKH